MVAVLDRLARLFAVPGTARHRWAQARSRADVGALAAEQIEDGSGHDGPVRIDESLGPAVRATLADLNRAGLVTMEAQPDLVRGYADTGTVHSLRTALDGTGCRVEVRPPAAEQGVRQRREVAHAFGGCAPAARTQMCGSWQVTIYAPSDAALRRAADGIRADRAAQEQMTAVLLRADDDTDGM